MIRSRGHRLLAAWAIYFAVAVVAFAIGIASYRAWIVHRTPRIPPPPPPAVQPVAIDYESAEPGSIKRAVLEAKARGETTVKFGVIGCGSQIGSLQSELSSNSVVLAELVAQKTYADTFNLHTWYKFKLKETLLEHQLPRRYSPFRSAPSDMLPIADDEFLIQEANGRMEIDGVTVIQHSNGAKYVEGQTYLVFLLIDPSTRTAIRAGTEPVGLFLVDSDGNLRPYINEPHPWKTAMDKRFQNSLHNMREALKKKTRH